MSTTYPFGGWLAEVPEVAPHPGTQVARVADAATMRRFFAVQCFSLIYLQKLGVTIGSLPSISVPVLTLLGHLFCLAVAGRLCVRPLRVICYAVFAGAALLTYAVAAIQGRASGTHSMTAITILLLLHGLMMVGWEVEWVVYEACIGRFITLMIVPAGMVFLQLLSQAVFGSGHSLNIETILPKAILLPGYIYNAPIHWGASFVRPNGFFMLEPSTISICLAVCIILELMHRRRLWLVAYFASALIGCLGGTGMVMMVIAAPFLLARQRADLVVRILALALVAVLVALPLGVADQFLSRSTEFDAHGSSASERVVEPAQQLVTLLEDPDFLVTGLGPGNDTNSAWPVTKAGSEYGLLVAALYIVMFTVYIGACPNWPLKLSLFCICQFTGGYLVDPTALILVFLLCMAIVPVRRRAVAGA